MTTYDQVLRLGTKLHDRIWASRRRVDSKNEQLRVETARRKIYQHGYVADGKAIDDILQDSKTPIRVRHPYGYPMDGDQCISILLLECVQSIPPSTRIQLLSAVCCRRSS